MIVTLCQRYPKLNRSFLITLFFYHTLLALAYYVYAQFNPSDSKSYYTNALAHVFGESLFETYGISTAFINFIAYFLVNDLGFTYESCMVFFSWLGFVGFLYFFVFFSERIRTHPSIYGLNFIWLLFLLPNLHFWSASLGKGAVIFCGFGLFFFAMNKPGPRFWALLLGAWLVFQIRPHIFYVLLIAISLAYTFSSKGVSVGYRIVILSFCAFLLYYIYDDIVKLTGLETESILDPLITHRASELTKATSGIDIVNYSFPEKLFAFWFRPLFFDAPGMLGIIVSFENLFYLIFFLQFLRPRAIRYLINSDPVVKTSLLTFLGVSVALAQISGNLGLAMRQKSQVMLLMLFVILKFLDEKRIGEWLRKKRRLIAYRRQREILMRS